jgi:hypothetical protein
MAKRSQTELSMLRAVHRSTRLLRAEMAAHHQEQLDRIDHLEAELHRGSMRPLEPRPNRYDDSATIAPRKRRKEHR